MARFLGRLGRAAARRHWVVLALAAVAVAGFVVWASTSGGETVDAFSVPGSESKASADLLDDKFPSEAGDSANVVFQAHSGKITDSDNAAAIAQAQAALADLDDVTAVTGPATPNLSPAFESSDGTIGYIQVQYSKSAQELPGDTFDDIEKASKPLVDAGLRVEYGGPVVDYANRVDPGDSDRVGVAVAVVVLLIAFGSVVAMTLPLVTSFVGLAVALSIITLVAGLTDIGTVAPTLATMLGLGVGIDYSLFIVTRHRQNLAEGMEVLPSIGHALATAGQAVLFAGSTVVIAILGLGIAGIPYVTRLGLTAAVTVAIMILAALTVLPALLGLIGGRIDSLHLPHLRRHRRQPKDAEAAGEGEGANDAEAQVEGRGWQRWARFVSRHRWTAVIVSMVLLLTLAAPVLNMRLGMSDDGTDPKSTTQRQAYDLLATGFGPGTNGPLLVALSLHTGDTSTPTAVQQALAGTSGVDEAGPPNINDDKDAAVIVVVPTTAPDSPKTDDLVQKLRDDVLPEAVSGTGATAYVGGSTATFIDLGDRIASRLLLFIGAVIALSFVLLMIVFRSILVPLKAAIMNLLSIGASYGVVVAVFQWGWVKGLVGLDETVPIVAFVPMMMFAILFGLSMDYEVFLLSRIREEYQRTGDNLDSVVHGLASTGRVISSAALIMISVFLAFVPNPDPTVKMLGLGLAVAVLVDATIVRLVLVPATMELLGPANWWLPRWLDRILPRIEIE
jgi:putative drug exporter of the RND superfamily